uniref:Menin n=1 Tax=Cacopsylla melanoneura TaxID=428564 RepID=A0A8D8YT63_9HEMI
MAGIHSLDKRLFPLKDIPSILAVFKSQMEGPKEPDLALLSIVVGGIENTMTCGRPPLSTSINTHKTSESEIVITDQNPAFFPIEFDIVEALYERFVAIVKGSVDLTPYVNQRYASRELVKKVSDVIWNSLTRSYYKDRAHLQSLYSYLTGNKLDCFGVAFAVVAAFQVLGYNDVHLALSEDHAWVVFGEHGSETAEVTWHGKGNEDKRGQPIGAGVSSKSWLYVNGCPVICNRFTEVAALVSSINPSLSATSESVEVSLLQQQLLWLMYDNGYILRYPMAIGNLGDLEEINPTPGRSPCSILFQEGIISSRKYYHNMHVYPYTYQGGYFYRHYMYKEAFESWANASDVIRQYNYSRDDEEIYKELMEIANELIPHAMKVASSSNNGSLLRDPECFAHLLRFYDGLCGWEEGSQTPVLHIGWAKPLVNTISKFDAEVRSQVGILPDVSEKVTPPPAATPPSEANNNEIPPPVKTSGADSIPPVGGGGGEAPPHPGIVALTAACGERILNREFLLQGGGEPFVGTTDIPTPSPIPGDTPPSPLPPVPSEEENFHSNGNGNGNVNGNGTPAAASSSPKLTLHSQKMRGLKTLLLNEKLNTSAISLQLTAQSQVQVGSKKPHPRSNDFETPMALIGCRSKRSRRSLE